ncbi:MAG: DUF6438 domain-containing protein [Methylococcales bacterium]|nr:DUF6438 domain-containing protein [Methylococcales bacterium]
MATRTFCKYTKYFIQPLLLASLCILKPAIAGLLDPPVITLSLIDCEKAYMVQIFEDGRVEYRGGFGVKTKGWHNANINPQDVVSLMKKIKETTSPASNDRENLPILDLGAASIAIRVRQESCYLTYFSTGDNSKSKFPILQQAIIKATNLVQWVNDPTLGHCLEKHSVRINNLKVTN